MNLHNLRQTSTFLLAICFYTVAASFNRGVTVNSSSATHSKSPDVVSPKLPIELHAQPDVVPPKLPTELNAQPGFVKSVLDGSDKPNMMGPINKFRAKVCSDMKDEHGDQYASHDACVKFMRDACHPGKDQRMDGGSKEVTSGKGFCKNFFGTAKKDEGAAKSPHEHDFEEKARAVHHELDTDLASAPSGAPAPAYRPREGDTVTILSTPNTKETFPEGIGKNFTIKVDEHTAQPYQVEGSSAWLYEKDIKLAKKKVILPDEKWYYKNGGTDVGRYHMDEKLRMPSQGYWGKLVEHDDMQTSVGDWQQEFGARNGPSRRKICESHPENAWCQQYVGALDAWRQGARSRASATTIHHAALALAVVFMCGVGTQ